MDDGANEQANQKVADELVWTVQRARLLFNYWTMPLLMNMKAVSTSGSDTASVRGFALLLIVALTFAVRGDMAGSKVSFAVLAAAVAALLSIGLSFISRAMNVTVREPALISAYASTILVMLGFLFVRAFFTGFNWYEGNLVEIFGPVLAAVVASVAIVYGLLGLKAIFWDKNKVTFLSALIGFGITIGSGSIVCIIAYISNDGFQFLIEMLCRIYPCRA